MSIRERTWITATERRLAAVEGREPRKQKAWIVDYMAYSHLTRQWERKTKTFSTQRAAKDWWHNNAKDIRNKKASTSKLMVQEAADIWLGAVKIGRDDRAPAQQHTLRLYRSLLKNHIGPALGGIKLAELTPGDVMAFRDRMLRTGHRPTARKAVVALKGILSEAVLRGHVAYNAAAGVKIGSGKGGQDKVVIPQIADVQGVLAKLDELAVAGPKGRRWRRYRVFLAICVYTGMRPGEVRGLPWKAIDFENAKIQVRQRADEKGNIEERTKTDAGRRTIPIPGDLLQMLRELKIESGKFDLVFATKKGKPEYLSNIARRAWFPVQIAAGLCDPVVDKGGNSVRDKGGTPLLQHRHNMYALRHFHASWLIADQANAKELQKQMGHSDPAFTLKVYGHLFEDEEANRRRAERSERMAGSLSLKCRTT